MPLLSSLLSGGVRGDELDRLVVLLDVQLDAHLQRVHPGVLIAEPEDVVPSSFTLNSISDRHNDRSRHFLNIITQITVGDEP